ncbi:MAG: alpha/beta hydrolase, partial [Methylobacteriaceae bacterium]|nr:alpha/beta hydrolase [Methylobacteriaceae bacterium]
MANRHLVALVAGLGLAALGLAGAIAFGTAAPPAELSAISAPFRSVDFSDAPPVERLPADPATPIAFRRWGPPDAAEVVVLLHGSTASSLSLHPLAKALA